MKTSKLMSRVELYTELAQFRSGRKKIRKLLQMAYISGMDNIQNLFKETIAEFMGNGLLKSCIWP